MSPTNQIKIK